MIDKAYIQRSGGEWINETAFAMIRGCRQLLEATIEDVHVTDFEDTPNYYWVACPSCGTTHKIPDRDVPPKAQQTARARR